MFKRRAATPDPRAEGLQEIDAWDQWFRNAWEDILRDYPDPHLIAAKRAEGPSA